MPLSSSSVRRVRVNNNCTLDFQDLKLDILSRRHFAEVELVEDITEEVNLLSINKSIENLNQWWQVGGGSVTFLYFINNLLYSNSEKLLVTESN